MCAAPKTPHQNRALTAEYCRICTAANSRLSDRIGRTRVYFWGALITAVSAFPGFWLMTHSEGDVMVIWLSIIIPFGIFYASVYGPEAALFCDLFDAKVRYTGISFVYQFSGIFASGITPIIATALLKSGGGEPWLICAYVLFAGVLSALCVWLIGRGDRGDTLPQAVPQGRRVRV